MNILITGGAGYIGSHAVRVCINEEHKVVVLDNLWSGDELNLEKGVFLYKGDIRDRNILDKIFNENKIDMVMHFAAKLLVDESSKKPLEYFDTNISGTNILLEKMTEYGVKKIVFSSTAAVYGMINKKEGLIEENDRTNPINPYGESKLACEKILKWWAEAHGGSYIIFRYFNVAGGFNRAMNEELETHIIPRILYSARGGDDEFKIFGNDYETFDGTCVRDYLHVEDIALAHLLAANKIMDSSVVINEVYNLGSGRGFSVKEIFSAAQSVLEKEIKVKVAPRRIGDPDVLVASNKKVVSDLGWKLKYTKIEDIILDMWKKQFQL